MKVDEIRNAVKHDKYQWRLHALERLAERNISQEKVLKTLLFGECIKEYPDDKPFPSVLFMDNSDPHNPLHVVVSYDEIEQICYVITCYVPDPEYFEDDFKTRKKQ